MHLTPDTWALVIRERWWEGTFDTPADGILALFERVGALPLEVVPHGWLVRHADPAVLRALGDRMADTGAAEYEGDLFCPTQVLVSPTEGPMGAAPWVQWSATEDGHVIDVLDGGTPEITRADETLLVFEVVLERRGWTYRTLPDGRLRWDVDLGFLVRATFTASWDERDVAVLLARLPGRVPMARCAAVADFLSRANWGLVLGNFDIDLRDGEVLFRTSCPLGGTIPSPDALAGLLTTACECLEHYGPGIRRVAEGEDPEEVLGALEEREDGEET